MITDIRIDELKGSHVQWEAVITLDTEEIPKPSHYAKRIMSDGHELYFGVTIDGHAHYAAHNPRNENGYGGAVMYFPLVDGTIDERRGCWSSRSSAMNRYFDQTLEVSIQLPQFPNMRIASAMTINELGKLIEARLLPYRVIQHDNRDDEPAWKIIQDG